MFQPQSVSGIDMRSPSTAPEVPSMARLLSELQRPAFNRWLAAYPVSVNEVSREIVVVLPYREEFSYHLTRPVFHGGVVASLIDLTGYASIALWSGEPTPTATLQIDFLAPAFASQLIAKGMVRKRGRTLSRVDVEIMPDGNLVALGRGTFSMGAQTS